METRCVCMCVFERVLKIDFEWLTHWLFTKITSFFLQPVSLHYVFVLNTEYSDKQLMIKITEFLWDWVGRSLWLYTFLVKVIPISLTFDLQCPTVLQHDYSLTGLEGIQSTFSRESGQRNKRACTFFWWKDYTWHIHTHGVSLCYVFMLHVYMFV